MRALVDYPSRWDVLPWREDPGWRLVLPLGLATTTACEDSHVSAVAYRVEPMTRELGRVRHLRPVQRGPSGIFGRSRAERRADFRRARSSRCRSVSSARTSTTYSRRAFAGAGSACMGTRRVSWVADATASRRTPSGSISWKVFLPKASDGTWQLSSINRDSTGSDSSAARSRPAPRPISFIGRVRIARPRPRTLAPTCEQVRAFPDLAAEDHPGQQASRFAFVPDLHMDRDVDRRRPLRSLRPDRR